MPKTRPREPRRPGEASERQCEACRVIKPIEEFYPRRSVPVTKRAAGKKYKKTKGNIGRVVDGNIGARLSNCIACANAATTRRKRLRWLRSLTLEQLQTEEKRTLELLRAILETQTEKRLAQPQSTTE